MNRRTMFGALFGAPALAIGTGRFKGDRRRKPDATVPSTPLITGLPANSYAFTPPQKCAKCGSATWTLAAGRWILPAQTLLMACSNYGDFDLLGCENHWPWLQRGSGQTRVSAAAKDAIYRYEELRNEDHVAPRFESDEIKLDRDGKRQAIEIFLAKELK